MTCARILTEPLEDHVSSSRRWKDAQKYEREWWAGRAAEIAGPSMIADDLVAAIPLALLDG